VCRIKNLAVIYRKNHKPGGRQPDPDGWRVDGGKDRDQIIVFSSLTIPIALRENNLNTGSASLFGSHLINGKIRKIIRFSSCAEIKKNIAPDFQNTAELPLRVSVSLWSKCGRRDAPGKH
jgi:hypothetical protein